MRFRFADFELDADRLELRKLDGIPLAIEPTPLRVLIDLVAHHPRSRSRAELLAEIWPGTTVTDASLSRAVSSLRRTLGESGREREILQTVQRSGYRIGVPVECLAGERAIGEEPRGERFVGRTDLLTALAGALVDALEGRGGIALLLGEPGIGKTRTSPRRRRRPPRSSAWSSCAGRPRRSAEPLACFDSARIVRRSFEKDRTSRGMLRSDRAGMGRGEIRIRSRGSTLARVKVQPSPRLRCASTA